MKFKKTKLTALAMSVLMAMSTITSVTWAADLFTDGAPAEIVTTPDDFVSDVEEQVVADDAALTGVSVADLVEVVFKYDATDVDNATKVVAQFTFNTGLRQTVDAQIAQTDLEESCNNPKVAIYKATVEGENGPITKYSNDRDGKVRTDGDTDYTLDSVLKDALNNPVRVYDPLPATTGRLVVPGSRFNGQHTSNPAYERVIQVASCAQVGKKVLYNGCSVCGELLVGTIPAPLPADFSWNNYVNQPDGTVVSVGGATITIRDIPVNDHTYDTANPKVVNDAYIAGIEAKFGFNSPEANYVRGLAPVNCILQNGTLVVENDGIDAYYYEVVECKYCGAPEEYKLVVLHDVSGQFNGTFYEPKSNVQGFVGLRGGIRVPVLFANNNNKIRVDRPLADGTVLVDPVEPILNDATCGRMGYYYVRTYDSDSSNGLNKPVSEKTVAVPTAHAWSNVEVAPAGTAFADGTVSATEDAKLLKDNNNDYVVVRDANGNVTDVKSINCVTRANYQLYKRCFNCGRMEKVGTIQTSDVNPDLHQWPTLPNGNPAWNRPDEEDSKYYKIDDETHKKYTYRNRYCELCGKKDLILDAEFTENHKLEETKYDDDGEDETYVAPTCGTSGSYDVILRCKCGFEDTESRKTTTIPATDRHDFGDNPAELQIIGTVQVGGRVSGETESGAAPHIVYAQIVRKCTVCGEYDSNGIDNETVGAVDGVKDKLVGPVGGTVIVDTAIEGRSFSDYVPAKTDPTTHVPYPCSVGQITVNFRWEGKVDGKATRLTGSKTVPYYINAMAYQGARAHEPGEAVIENKVDATADTAGSYDKVLYCRVCGDEISRETFTVDPETIIPVPTVKAKAANYNTINLTWNAVEGATSYDVYYRSTALGVNDWTLAKSVTGTSFNYSGLITGVKYRFTVSAVAGENSSEIGVNTSVATPKLAAPVIKTVTAVKKGTKVTWTKVDGANGYIIQSKTASGKWTRVATLKKGAKVSWTDKKAASGTTYRVRAYRTVDAPNISKNNVYGPFSAAK